jgi:hypothetical protein
VSKSIPRSPPYRARREEPKLDIVLGTTLPPPGYEPPPPRWLAWGLLVFWALVIGGVGLLYSCQVKADGFQVYLEGEDDLGNGFKLCHYTEGVTITVRDSQLCPLSIKVPQ